MKANEFDVVVVGGGMIGAACALALAEKRFRVALVERHVPHPVLPGDPMELRVSAVSRASEQLLRNLGAWDAIEKVRVSPYSEMHVWDTGGGSVHFDAAELGEPCLGHIVENRVIQAALWERLGTEADADVFAPAIVESVSNSEQGAELVLDDGKRLRTRLLVAADGAASPLRTQFGIGVSGANYGQQGIVCVIDTEKSHGETARQRFMPSGPLAFLPLSGGSVSIVWSADDAEATRLMAMTDEQFCTALQTASEGVLGAVMHCGKRAAFPLRRQHAETYIAPSAVLIGDAAHVVHPLAGQGANLGFLDVAALAETLEQARDAGRDFAQPRVLRRYERWRRGDNLATLWTMDGFKRLFGTDDTVLSGLRNLGFRLFDRATPLKREAMRQAMGLRKDLPDLARKTPHP
ncbi:MAG: UbiH/UbiF/VisC/COQ6 family ubiquinone biosynthesis hydroxylase [Proteobacteria bacterium]|nr:UbiH/UbiF/VisC/COQ6 family ubiquinone biosynthesis hydroxylase [Pseudomonadota bacterium]